MVLPGETITGPDGTGENRCRHCEEQLFLRVCRSNAGYYVGTWCKCGPYSRESGYYLTREEAQAALDSGVFGR